MSACGNWRHINFAIGSMTFRTKSMVKLFAFCCRRIGPVLAVILLSTVTAKAGQDCAAVPLPVPACQAGTHSVCAKFYLITPADPPIRSGSAGVIR